MGGTSKTIDLYLSAHIENEDFFSYSVTKFGFDDSNLVVDYNNSEERFYSKATDIILETDIPIGFTAGFELIPTKLDSVCENAKGEQVQKDFANYWVEEEKLIEGSPIHYDTFNNDSGLYRNDKRRFTVSFDSLPGFDVKKAYCSGSATLLASLDF